MTVNRGVRRARSFALDPRFMIGIGLVISSVIGVYAIVESVDDTTEVLAARVTITPGDRVERGDLVERSVRLGGIDDKYLTPADLAAEGKVATRTVLAGGLGPRSALGSTETARLSALVVTTATRLPARVGEGSVIDLWSSAALDASSFGPPTVLVPGATVAHISKSEGLVSDGRGVSVELLVPRDRVASV